MGVFEGVSLYSYGHSWTIWPNPWCSQYGGEYQERVRTRLGMGRGYYRGRSSTPLQDTLPMILSDAFSRQWTPGATGIVLHQNFMNEAASTAGQSALYRSAWGSALTTALALFGAGSVISADDATRTGTWTKLTNAPEWWWDSTCWFTKTAGASVRFAAPAGVCWLLLGDSCESYDTGIVEVKVGSTVVARIDTNGRMEKFTSVHTNPATGTKYVRSYSPAAYRIETNGQPVTVTATESKTTLVSALLVESRTPPHVFYGVEPPRNPIASGADLFATAAPLFAEIAAEVVAQFRFAHLVDLGDGWDNSTMISTRDPQRAHPHDVGMCHLADLFCDAITGTLADSVDGVQVM